jgi:hypothetical protein
LDSRKESRTACSLEATSAAGTKCPRE